METAESLYQDILAELIINGAQQAVKAFDAKVAIRYMNRWMAEIDADGIDLGYTIVSEPTDIITVPLGAINAIVYNVAYQIAGRYDSEIGGDLVDKARKGMKTLRKLAVGSPESPYPYTLPVGSGNEGDEIRVWKFYPREPDVVDAETTGPIVLEENTLNEQ